MFTAEQLLDDAVAETGLDDFGPPTFREGLDRVVDGLAGEAALTEIGEAAAQSMLVGPLQTRLRMEQWWGSHPELEDERVEAPWCIVGVARSGTTALSHLLSRDPTLRSLRAWEVNDPFPPPTDEGYDTDPRYVAAREAPAMLELINPDFKAIHDDPPDMPIECVTSLVHEFVSLQLNTVFHLPSYAQWVLHEADQAPAYAWHDRLLRVLGSQTSGRWQLKTPHHGLAIDTLVAQWPDVRGIVTHRDPIECVASTTSLLNTLIGTFSDADHRASNASMATEMIFTIIDNVRRHREVHGSDRFVDIAYREFVADSVAAVGAAYDQLGETLSAEAEAAMAAHVAEHTKDRHGRHQYDLVALGLDRAELSERFAPYTEAYGHLL